MKKGQLLLLAQEGCYVRHHTRYGTLAGQIEMMCVGGIGTYEEIYVVKVQHVIDVRKRYAAFVRRRDKQLGQDEEACVMLIPGAMYFGCDGDAGRFLWTTGMVQLPWRVERTLPGALQPSTLDGGYCPTGEQHEGRALLHHVHGCTVLAFWDRSVDSRPGSHSTFVLPGELGFDAACAEAMTAFPDVWRRFKFRVVEERTR